MYTLGIMNTKVYVFRNSEVFKKKRHKCKFTYLLKYMFNKVRSSDHCSWLIERMKITCVQKELFHIHDLCPPNYNFFTIVHASPLYFLTTWVSAMEAYSDQHTGVTGGIRISSMRLLKQVGISMSHDQCLYLLPVGNRS